MQNWLNMQNMQGIPNYAQNMHFMQVHLLPVSNDDNYQSRKESIKLLDFMYLSYILHSQQIKKRLSLEERKH